MILSDNHPPRSSAVRRSLAEAITPGTGTSASQTLHRVEESVVRAEVEAAGFRLATSADFLRNTAAPRDWNASPGATTRAGRRGQADRFILKFVKP